ncbi:cation:proton antiporter family protein [Alteromonas lipolytica]|uniref:Potassium transporter Kef n=1 Tax=Alteromonas lipolytica TaxID=1856405 RepID=A0A1E8FH24_9ALTE|nr:cation:proton antiporter family protein [Alteromonas lipolytica]OFI35214.1 potassium transporter Kef [Alteromonas lipolytica]GGF57675.1 potassium transporter Kef [Alteromonas lipolytica]
MEYIFLLFAFICGLGVKLIGIPPLVGYLVAGFLLNAFGFVATPAIDTFANLGITIMLFTIGLKLNLKDLSKREVWAGSIGHTVLWVVITSAILLFVGTIATTMTGHLDWQSAALIAFALSFSSTVCVVKVLEEAGESKTRHGKLAIGVLVMQDIFAVIFLVIATGKIPSLWAPLLLLLIPAMPLLKRVLNQSGHGELLPLTGFIFALGGYHLFELVNIKGDLGALIFGLLFAPHPKASEMAKALLAFKDLFLIGFFLSIGLTALPDMNMLIIAGLLVLLIPVKFLLFFWLFTRLNLRGRTAYLGGLVLSNYSEFGLIVGALAVSLGLLGETWLVMLAVATSISFVLTSIIYRYSHSLYQRIKEPVKRLESPVRLSEDIYPEITRAKILVVGLGRVGIGAFTSLNKVADANVWGMDADRGKIQRLQKDGLNVINGDGEDVDLWENLDIRHVQLVLLALPSIEDAINITKQLKNAGYQGKIAAIARYEDEVSALAENGVDKVFNFFTEAGLGFAEESLSLVD